MLESINNRLINASSALPRTKHLEKRIAAAVCLFIFFLSSFCYRMNGWISEWIVYRSRLDDNLVCVKLHKMEKLSVDLRAILAARWFAFGTEHVVRCSTTVTPRPLASDERFVHSTLVSHVTMPSAKSFAHLSRSNPIAISGHPLPLPHSELDVRQSNSHLLNRLINVSFITFQSTSNFLWKTVEQRRRWRLWASRQFSPSVHHQHWLCEKLMITSFTD